MVNRIAYPITRQSPTRRRLNSLAMDGRMTERIAADPDVALPAACHTLGLSPATAERP